VRALALIAAAAVGACNAVPPQPPSPQAEMKLRQELAGRVAGEPRRCLPRGRSHNVSAIGDTLLFRDGSRIWLSRSEGGGCDELEASNYTLVTRSYGPGRTCSGDLGRVVDLTSDTMVGVCVLGPFVPYTRS
jgi:hypothetical protein